MDLARLLHNRSFSKIWTAQILSQIAQNLLTFALVIRVFTLASHTRFANIAVSLMLLAFGIPAILFGSAAGVLVDYWNRKTVLVMCNLLRAVLVLLFLIFENNLWAVYSISFVISSITQLFAPAESASLPRLVKNKLLLTANSLFIFTIYAAWVVGYSSSALVINWFGNHGPYLVTGLMFAVATLLAIRLPNLPSKQSGDELRWGDVVQRTTAETAENWRTIITNRQLYFPIMQLTITQAFISVLLVLAPAVSVALLHTSINNASQFLIIPAGLGMIAGVVVVSRLARRISKAVLINTCLTLAAGGLILLGLVGQLYRHVHGLQLASRGEISWIVAVLVFGLGMMNSIIGASSQTLLQEHTSDLTRGKVFGALNVMVNAASFGPVLIAGFFADLFSVTRVLFALGVLLLIYAIYQTLFLRQFEREAEEAAVV